MLSIRIQRTYSAQLFALQHGATRGIPRVCNGRQRAVAATAGSPGSESSSAWSSMSSSDLEGIEANGGKLKLLCLHGFMQTADSFRMRIGSLRKALKSRVEFVFLDAPFEAGSALSEDQIQELGGSATGRTWLKWRDQATGKRPSQSTQYEEFDATYKHMADALRRHAPDGVLGFSQGATSAALLLAQLQRERAEGRDLDVPPPRFGVLVSGFMPRDPVYAALLSEERTRTPCLFILGEADNLVAPERTLALMDTFDVEAAALLRHPGGHFVPTCSGDTKRRICEFLDTFRGAANGASGAPTAGDDVTASENQEAAVVS